MIFHLWTLFCSCTFGYETKMKARGTVEIGCLIGGVSFSVGDFVGSIGLTCYDEGSYKGHASYCGENSSLYYEEKTLSCPAEAPYCFQCGEAAKCLSYSSAAPEGCSPGGIKESSSSKNTGTVQAAPGFNETSSQVNNGYCGRFSDDNSVHCDPNATACTRDTDCTNSNYSSCLSECRPQVGSSMNNTPEVRCQVGDIVYSIGELVGSIGVQCYDNNTYIGLQSFCGKNGSVYYQDTNLSCPDEAPYCFQCGNASNGAAKCLSNYGDSPEGCTLGEVSTKNISENQSSNYTRESNNMGYCGLLSSDGTYFDCDPSAVPCIDDSSCNQLMLYKNCLKECGAGSASSRQATNPTSGAISFYGHLSFVVFMSFCSICGLAVIL